MVVNDGKRMCPVCDERACLAFQGDCGRKDCIVARAMVDADIPKLPVHTYCSGCGTCLSYAVPGAERMECDECGGTI